MERNYDTNKTCLLNDYKIKKNDLVLLYNNKANELKKRYGIEKRNADQAITDANNRILTCLENIDRIRVESKGNIQKAFYIKKERHDTSIANLNKLISETQKELDQLEKEKTQLEKEMNGVFVLSIKKKQALKDKLNENAHIITQTAEKLATYQKKLTPLLNEDPEAEMKVVLRMLDEMYENVRSVSNGKIIETPIIGNRNVNSLLFDFANSIKPIQQEFILLNIRLNEIKKMDYDAAMDSAMYELKHSFESEEDKIKKEAIDKQEKLDNELEMARCSIENTSNEIIELKKKLEEKSVSLKEKNSQLPSLQEQLDNSHIQFLIHNFSDMINVKEIVKNKKDQIKKVSSEIRVLNKELQTVEKAIANAEKEVVKKAEIDRKLKIEQEEREQRIHKELKDREKELSLISSKKELLSNIPDVVRQLEADSSNVLLSENSCPLKDDGKRIITNGIVRKSYSQKNSDYDCDQYLLLFVDSCGNPISDQRLIQKKKVGETTNTSFELSSPDGFNSKNYYLIMLDFDTGNIISVQRYKINIAFANEFNF